MRKIVNNDKMSGQSILKISLVQETKIQKRVSVTMYLYVYFLSSM
jgi:hypothetical protein